jgi:hypothetical protein
LFACELSNWTSALFAHVHVTLNRINPNKWKLNKKFTLKQIALIRLDLHDGNLIRLQDNSSTSNYKFQKSNLLCQLFK